MFTNPRKQIQKKHAAESTRVVVVGCGNVGATTAFSLLTQGLCSELVIIDRNKDKAEGEVMDLVHGLSFVPHCKVWAGTYADCKTADIVIITAGAKQKPGETRLQLADTNIAITTDIVKNIRRYTKQAVIIMVTNPLDVTTLAATQAAGYPWGQVFGTGTTLDSSRFRYLLAEQMGVDPDSVGAYLLGEHGDSSVPVYSHANVMGESLPLTKAQMKKAYDGAKNAAYDVINRKGATFYAIALAVSRIVRAVLFDESHVFTVSVKLQGEYGLRDVCLSVPAVVGRTGVKKVLEVKLSADEKKALARSAKVVRETAGK